MSNSTGTEILTMTSVGPAAWTSTSSVALSPLPETHDMR